MRMLDIVEIEVVAGGARASIGAHPLSTSIHHAKAHKKVHAAKAQIQHGKGKTFSKAVVHPADEGEGDGGDGDGDGDGDGGGDGDGDGGADGTDDGYIAGLPPVPFTIQPITVGPLQISFTFNSTATQVSAVFTVDDSSVEHPVLTDAQASAVGTMAQTICASYAQKLGGQIACAGLGSAVSAVLSEWTMSANDWTQAGNVWSHTADMMP